MREQLGSVDIANQISMLRSVFGGTILVVEGTTDMRLYGKMIDDSECEIVAAHSKDNVRLAVTELHYRRKDEKVMGIMDSDIDRISDNIPKPPLFLTDARDAEMMLIKHSALEDVLWEYADKDAMDEFIEKHGEIRSIILESSYPIGLFMYLSHINDLGLCFKDLDFMKFIDPLTLRLNIRNMIEEVIYNSRDPAAPAKVLRERLDKELENEYDPWIICRGHDAVEILLLGLRRIFGGYNARNLKRGELSGALRLAYDLEDFMKTDLYKETKEWCAARGVRLWAEVRNRP